MGAWEKALRSPLLPLNRLEIFTVPKIRINHVFRTYHMDNQHRETDTSTLVEHVGEGIGYISTYIDQEVELAKLEVAEKISIASSALITGLVLSSAAVLVVIFGAVALGFYLSTVLASDALGFLCVTVIFLIFFVLVYFFRGPLITDKIVAAVIHIIFDQEQEDETN